MPPIIKHNGSSSISDYVVDCDKVPTMTEKNRDKSIIVSRFDFVISNLYTKPVKNDTIRVYSNDGTAYPFFSGVVLEVTTNYYNDTYAVSVISEFYKLQNERLSLENLHDELLQTSDLDEYCPSDNFSLPNVQVLYAIKKMFFLCGMNLQISTALRDNFIKQIIEVGVPYNMDVKHLVFDENTMYAIGQTYALNYTGINADPEKRLLVPSYFDFIREFCCHVGAHVYLVSSGNPNWYQMDLIGDPTPGWTSDYIYGKSENDYIGSNEGYVHNIRFNSDRTKYNSSTPSNLTDHKFLSGDGANQIDLPENWIYMFRKTASMGGNPGDVLGHAYLTSCWTADEFLQNKIKEVTSDFKETELEINNFLPSSAKSTRLDLKTEEAEVVWSEEK